MNDKNEKIEYELRRLSDSELPPEDKILGKARAEMRRKAASKPSPNKTKAGWVVGICSLAAAFAVVVIIGVSKKRSTTLPDFPSISDFIRPAPDADEANEFGGYYSAEGLTARRVSYSQANELYEASTGNKLPLPNEGILADGTTVMNLTVTAFKNESGEDVLLECKMRCIRDGGYDDLTVWFELTDKVYEGNKEYLKLYNGNKVKYKQSRENGEYVSRAYIKNKYGCMLNVMNSGEYNLNYYLELIFGISEEDAI